MKLNALHRSFDTITHFWLSNPPGFRHNRGVMWKGRFSKPTADLVQRYGESVSYDWRLFRQDIAGSIAHARHSSRQAC